MARKWARKWTRDFKLKIGRLAGCGRLMLTGRIGPSFGPKTGPRFFMSIELTPWTDKDVSPSRRALLACYATMYLCCGGKENRRGRENGMRGKMRRRREAMETTSNIHVTRDSPLAPNNHELDPESTDGRDARLTRPSERAQEDFTCPERNFPSSRNL